VPILNKVIIGQSKIFFATYDDESNKWTKQDIARLGKPLPWYFPYAVEVEESVTIRNLLTHLKNHADHVSLVFCGYLGETKLEDFTKELDMQPDPEFKDRIDLVEFFWEIEMLPLTEDSDIAEFNIDTNPSMRGYNKHKAKEISEEDAFDEEFDLTLIPVRNYIDALITINHYVEYATLDEISEPLPNVLLDGEMNWDFFNLISAFLMELSFYGTPEDQIKMQEEIKKEETGFADQQAVIEHGDLIDYLDSLSERLRK